jgi:ferredoxin
LLSFQLESVQRSLIKVDIVEKSMKVRVDREACIGAGQCALVAGSIFDQDDEGLVILLVETPGEDSHAMARKAATLCPAKAISIEE